MLSSDFANLAFKVKRMLSLGADWLHMDIVGDADSGLDRLWQKKKAEVQQL
ncbi:hypothetical protein SO802_010906 [Lithocarpus litseifolius]|uniref:Ribulose-phosphate 3-epimerase n=1 Tax=Lithocarpus litseifolius TaxID=425828 RepID=A0AAW2DGS2_9ROSI